MIQTAIKVFLFAEYLPEDGRKTSKQVGLPQVICTSISSYLITVQVLVCVFVCVYMFYIYIYIYIYIYSSYLVTAIAVTRSSTYERTETKILKRFSVLDIKNHTDILPTDFHIFIFITT